MPAEMMLQKYSDSPSTPIYLPLELKAMDAPWLSQRIEEALIRHDCRLFLIDHLHFLIDMSVKQNMSLNVGGFMRQLKTIARELRVAIILIAHQGKTPKGEEPSLEDIRDSSFVAQESDNVIIVWRRPDYSANELRKLETANPALAASLSARIDHTRMPLSDSYEDGFAFVQIAKARRSGTYRWKKLFQKVGDWLEEV
jgi:replicative DNA helicase